MKKIDISNKIVMILNYIFMLMFIMIVLKNNKIQLLLYISIVPFLFFLLINNIKSKRISILALFLIIISIFNVILNSFFVGYVINFTYYKKLIMFIMSIIYFDLLSHYKMDTAFHLKHINIINNFIIIFLIIVFVNNPTNMHIYNNRVVDALCFNFTNPNLTALFLLSLFITELILYKMEKNKGIKLLELIFLVILFLFIYMTGSRAAIFSSILFLIIFIIFKNKNIFKNNIAVLLIVLLPIVFSSVYMHIINNQSIVDKIQNIPTLDNGLDSRVSIWKVAYNGIKNSPLIGSYNEISYGTGQSQMHNSHLDILASYGVIPFILFVVFLYKLFKYKEKQNYIYLYGFATFIICGCLEAALFSGSAGLFIYVGNLIMLTNSDLYNKKEQKVII